MTNQEINYNFLDDENIRQILPVIGIWSMVQFLGYRTCQISEFLRPDIERGSSCSSAEKQKQLSLLHNLLVVGGALKAQEQQHVGQTLERKEGRGARSINNVTSHSSFKILKGILLLTFALLYSLLQGIDPLTLAHCLCPESTAARDKDLKIVFNYRSLSGQWHFNGIH